MSAKPLPDPIDLRAWRQFLAVAESLHFGRAAERLHMSQPPLTQGIQRLEAQLGYSLFERNRRRVALTASGSALVEPVRQLLRAAAVLPELGRTAGCGELGTLRLGFVSTIGFDPLPQWLRAFRHRYPRVAVQLVEATSDAQLRELAGGSLDAGFLVHAPRVAPAPNIPLLSVGIEPLVLALPRGRFVTSGRFDVVAALESPLVIFPRQVSPSLYDSIIAYYHERGAAPTIGQEAIQMQTIVNLVSAGLGVAFVPRVVAKFRRSGVEYRPLPQKRRRVPQVETSLTWAPDASPVAERFVAHVRGLLSTIGRS